MIEWRMVPGYGRELHVSSSGRVRMLDHRGEYFEPKQSPRRSRSDREGRKGRGHLYVVVRLRNQARKKRFVHQLVHEAFHGPIPRGLVVRHKDGDELNNSADNLHLGTQAENIRDQIKHGSTPRAQRVVSDDLVRAARILHREGYTQGSIADFLGIARTTITDIVRGNTRRAAGELDEAAAA